MVREFIRTHIFEKRWSEMDLTDEDLRKLENFLLKNPNAGDVIQGTGGAVKLRWSLPGTSKSGGLRVIYIDMIRVERVFLVTCYPKSQKDTLTAGDKATIKETIKHIVKCERIEQ